MNLIASSQLTVIIGLGVTGLSAARFLQKTNVNFIVMDSRENPPNKETFINEFPDVRLITSALDSHILLHASEIVISPGMSLKTPELQRAIQAGIPVIGDIELFARVVNKPIIAITGSNAKSTVTTLVGEMTVAAGLTPAVGGNLGVPVLDLLLECKNDDTVDIFILELSSFQLETTFSLKAKVATVLNVSVDHMDRYDSLASYHKAKQRIYLNAEQLVVNRQDFLTQPPLSQDAVVWSFGDNRPDLKAFGLITSDGEQYLAYQFKKLMPVSELKIKGKHNAVNALSALALGFAAGFEMDAMLSALKQFKGLEHRCECVTTHHHVAYINDSKATNVGATIAAINGFASESSAEQKQIILIAGGDAKDADFSTLAPIIQKHVRLLVLIGQDADCIADAVLEIEPAADIQKVSSLVEAVATAKQAALSGDVVLLSPACASFDMFSGFEDRGQQFIAAVKAAL